MIEAGNLLILILFISLSFAGLYMVYYSFKRIAKNYKILSSDIKKIDDISREEKRINIGGSIYSKRLLLSPAAQKRCIGYYIKSEPMNEDIEYSYSKVIPQFEIRSEKSGLKAVVNDDVDLLVDDKNVDFITKVSRENSKVEKSLKERLEKHHGKEAKVIEYMKNIPGIKHHEFVIERGDDAVLLNVNIKEKEGLSDDFEISLNEESLLCFGSYKSYFSKKITKYFGVLLAGISILAFSIIKIFNFYA